MRKCGVVYQGRWTVLPAIVLTGFGPVLGGSPFLLEARADITGAGAVTTLRVSRGEKIALPVQGVTRVIAEDDDIARGVYINGKAAIEGVTTGTTQVEVHLGAVERRLFAVQVEEPGKAIAPPPSALATTPAPTAPTIAAAPVKLAVPAAVTPAPAQPAPAPAQPTTIAATLPPVTSPGSGSITPAVAPRSNLGIELRVQPVEDNPLQALFTITYANRGTSAAQGVKVHYALDDLVSYVTNSATNNGQYDAAARELVWNIGTLPPASAQQSVSFRVEPIDRKPVTFYSVATIDDASDVSVASNNIRYSTAPTPLLTVFALPDRILAGRNAPVLVDVQGAEMQVAIDRIQKLGIVSGRAPGLFYPNAATHRVEYTVMTLNGLNLHDLRDVTAIKFVLGRRSNVTLNILNNLGKVVAPLLKNQPFEAGERTVIWDGSSGAGYAPPGRYTYVCVAKDAQGQTTSLRGHIQIVAQTPLEPMGKPTFTDVKPSDWYAGYLAIAEKQNLVRGYADKTFRPTRPINREEATTIVVRALGLEDLARRVGDKDAGFLDYQNISRWAVPYINVAASTRTANGKTVLQGYPGNFFLPQKNLRRDEAALLVQRLIDNERVRTISVSGALVPGATVTINNQTIQASPTGEFEFKFEQTTELTTVAVTDARR